MSLDFYLHRSTVGSLELDNLIVLPKRVFKEFCDKHNIEFDEA